MTDEAGPIEVVFSIGPGLLVAVRAAHRADRAKPAVQSRAADVATSPARPRAALG
jgi:hypothetical protein